MKVARAVSAIAALVVLSALSAGAGQFVKYVEPNQKAFTAQVPAGWLTEGGVVMWPVEKAGAMNATESKVEWTVKKDAAGTVMGKWLPDINFIDMTGSPAGGMFAPGSQCNGAIVMPRLGCVNYLLKVVLPHHFPKARNVKVINTVRVPDAEKALDQLRAMMGVGLTLDYKAYFVGVEYDEGGVHYRQLMFTAIEDMVRLGLGLWKTRSTIIFRAPAGQADAALVTLTKVHQSIQINMEWLKAEMIEAAKRAGAAADTFERIRQLDSQITKNRRDTNEAIMQQMQKVLTKVD